MHGKFKYSVLQKFVKSLLSLVHGNADVERSLSANKRTATPERASLGDLTINGLRAVKDHIKNHGEPHNVPITKGLLQASREAHKAYSKRLLMKEKSSEARKNFKKQKNRDSGMLEEKEKRKQRSWNKADETHV